LPGSEDVVKASAGRGRSIRSTSSTYARLCSAARDGEILVEERTAELVGTNGLEPRGAMQLKGLTSEVAVFAVPCPP
jgi:class 3 adenylate cyclase